MNVAIVVRYAPCSLSDEKSRGVRARKMIMSVEVKIQE